MLCQLTVKNFALVNQLELEFSRGMTVVTGETGAGKSIMLDALGLTLGDRSETGSIGFHAEKAEIHATFDLSDNQTALDWLQSRELLTDQPECILRRVIGKDGRSRGFINGAPSTVNDMKTLGEMLIDIHSQHEHQSLLKKETHCRLLDDFAKASKHTGLVAELFHRYRASVEKLEHLVNNNEEQSARLQLLSYQAEELNLLAIQPGEHALLDTEQKRLANAESILRNCSTVIDLSRRDDSNSILEQLGKSVQLLNAVDLDDIRPISDLLGTARIQIEEAIHDLERFGASFELDPARLAEVEDRLSAIYDLCRKHRVEPKDIENLQQRINDELQSLGNVDLEIAKLEDELEEVKLAYFKAADRLTAARSTAAIELKNKVSNQLSALGMTGAVFDIALICPRSGQPGLRGMEDVEFLITTNPSQSPRPLNKIASGGELSRISLAIQVVTADTSQVPSLVFDEVDVGIGGAVAEVVGSLLRSLGDKTQIVCVTHLPQVAAQGHQHLKVTKSKDELRPQTDVHQLTKTEKVEEIARMLGGIEMTDQSLAHAEEMYKTAQA